MIPSLFKIKIFAIHAKYSRSVTNGLILNGLQGKYSQFKNEICEFVRENTTYQYNFCHNKH